MLSKRSQQLKSEHGVECVIENSKGSNFGE